MAKPKDVSQPEKPKARSNGKHPGGRPPVPSKLTPKVIEGIVEALKVSVPLNHAAAAQGVSETQVHEWMKRGRAGEKPYDEFSDAVTRAQSQAVLNLTSIALGGGKGSSQATWLLERRYRQEYGPTQRIEHSGPDGKPIEVKKSVREMTDEELMQIIHEDRGDRS